MHGSRQCCVHGAQHGGGEMQGLPLGGKGGLALRFARREWKTSPSGMGAKGNEATERALERTQQAAPSSDFFFNLPHNVEYTRRRRWRGR